jgi:serine/threonine protein kinase
VRSSTESSWFCLFFYSFYKINEHLPNLFPSATVHAEYGMSEEMSTKGDVYSFGVLLLEMLTGYRPTDEKFKDGTCLHEYVNMAFPNNINEAVDPIVLQEGINATRVLHDCVIPLVKLGLCCSTTTPSERPGMGQISTEILAIKHVFSNIISGL